MDHLPPTLAMALQKIANLNTDHEISMGKDKKKSPNPLSYPKSGETYSSELFKKPTSEYRGFPFWAWNTKLNKDELIRQIGVFEEMGMGQYSNFVLHDVFPDISL